MDTPDTYRIRPAGRHLLTIGRDLIQDQYAAVVELVKNAYDADSPDIKIIFNVSDDRKNITIKIVDQGHGMSRDTVINKWLVPSTDDKFKRKISPKGRIMQGRKGIGRYAASILGETLFLETITAHGEKTEVLIDWSDFEKEEFLSDVEVLVSTTKSTQSPGTILTMTGGKSYLAEWEHDDKQIKNLDFELRKLIHPINTDLFPALEKETFEIFLYLINFYENQETEIIREIKPFPIIELYDYGIFGTINSNGKGSLNYRNQKVRNTIDENIPIDLKHSTGCGQLVFDIRVYDREANAIDHLIKRGLKDEHGVYLGNLQARILLNEYNGIGVYRNGFRIRPLGNAGFDWLKLNMERIQNPSLRIGSNQVIGFVLIESEESSSLIEKSARDGLKENTAYSRLIDITHTIIEKLETRRFEYRKKAGLSRTTVKIESELEKLFAFDELKDNVRSKLMKAGVSNEISSEVINIIAKKEDENNQVADNIRQTVAIYQGQATLGKIINVVLHEASKPLSFFTNQARNIRYYAKELKTTYSEVTLDKLLSLLDNFEINAEVLINFFERLDPLAAKKRGKKKELYLDKVLNGIFSVFEKELEQNKIKVIISCPQNSTILAWEQDIYSIMTNLIQNSIFWIENNQKTAKEIDIFVSFEQTLKYIDYRDTGTGIEEHLIESGVIFEPEFTTKPEGTGLGLAIAGEAALRNGLELKAFVSTTGAYFRLEPKEGE